MYKFLVSNGLKVMQEIWQMKIPLKNKIFMWFLKKRVILTKDNLARRSWNGSKVCCFCNNLETTQHLFFDRHYACFLWCAVYWVFGITPPTSVSQLFGDGQNWAAANTVCLFWHEHRPCVGQSGSQEMISFLTKAKNKLFCRYCSGGHIGSDSGFNYNAWMSTRLPLWRHAGF